MKIILISVILTFFTILKVEAQADTLMKFCATHIPSSYVSDGQVYQTPVSEGETAEFALTFYGGSTYRIAACAGIEDGNLTFSLYDKDRNELFSSTDHDNAPFWDFKFTSTVECYLEAQISPESTVKSAFAIILIGFKN
ncbi:MAG: hypothetical protein II956_15625 [Bacteroidales bacterium]|nr:hypothetical protein [Bacteroidales bacterium]